MHFGSFQKIGRKCIGQIHGDKPDCILRRVQREIAKHWLNVLRWKSLTDIIIRHFFSLLQNIKLKDHSCALALQKIPIIREGFTKTSVSKEDSALWTVGILACRVALTLAAKKDYSWRLSPLLSLAPAQRGGWQLKYSDLEAALVLVCWAELATGPREESWKHR